MGLRSAAMAAVAAGAPACYCFIFNIAFVVCGGNLEMEAAFP